MFLKIEFWEVEFDVFVFFKERLLQVSFPEKIAAQLTKACMAFGDTSSEKRFAQKRIPACTFVLVDIVGISQLLTMCQPTDFLRIINSLITAFDVISQVRFLNFFNFLKIF